MSISEGATHENNDPPANNPGTPGGTSSGTSYASSSGSSGGSTGMSDAERKARRNAATVQKDYYRRLLVKWGVRLKTKAQKKAINPLINKLANNYYNTRHQLSPEQFQKQIVKRAPRAWLRSTVGAKRMTEVKQVLTGLYGEDYATALKNKTLIKLMKNYSKSLAPDLEKFSAQMLKTARGKKEFAYFDRGKLYGQQAGATLSAQLASYKKYEETLNQTLANLGLDPAADAQMFFKSGISDEDFTSRVGTYVQNRDAFKTVAGREMTDTERRQAFYDVTGQGIRQQGALGRAGAQGVAAAFGETGEQMQAYRGVLGRGVSAAERTGVLYGTQEQAQSTLSALGRSADVQKTLGQQAGAYQWQRGQAVNQGQKESLVYNTAQAANIYDALKSAFSINRAYNKGSAGSFGLARNQSGQIVTQGV